jgi:molybdopterin-guanine dinucleotide biosynthesis protein A
MERASLNKNNPSLFAPSNYKEMDEWLNALSRQAWLGILGSYIAGGHRNVILYMRVHFTINIVKWKDKDLLQFFNCRKLNDFRSRSERA